MLITKARSAIIAVVTAGALAATAIPAHAASKSDTQYCYGTQKVKIRSLAYQYVTHKINNTTLHIWNNESGPQVRTSSTSVQVGVWTVQAATIYSSDTYASCY